MRLYPRQLTSLKDLQKEKAKLQKLKEAEEKEEKKDKAKGEDKGAGILGLVSNLAGAGPVANIVLSKVIPALLSRRKKAAKAAALKEEYGPKKTGLVASIAKDMIFGYIKWKILEFAFKLVKNFLQKRKERKLENKVLAAAAVK